MNGELIFILFLLCIGLAWAFVSKKQTEKNETDEYGNWMESMPRWGKVSLVLFVSFVLYWFWIIL